MTYKTPMKATDPCELERRIMDGSIAKNEAEWWAQHEIERLRGELEEAKVTRGNGVLVPSDELKRMKAQLAAKAATIEKLRSAFQEYIDEHEECTDADDWLAMMCSVEAHHVADEALAATQDPSAVLRERDAALLDRIAKRQDHLAGTGLLPWELRQLAAKIRNGEYQP